jgi:PEP-CTERM motif-containing protein
MRKLLLTATAVLSIAAWASWAHAQIDVTAPGDPIVLVNGTNDGDGNSGPPPAAEGVEHVIDNVRQKYLNFLDLGSGFVVTPALGSTVITGARFYTANDAMERDPASYLIEGSTTGAGGPWTSISAGDLALPTGRNITTAPFSGLTPINSASDFLQTIAFANSTAYTSYRVTFPTLRDAGLANSMQIAEVELLSAVPEPSTIALVGTGVIGLAVAMRRRRK